MKHYFWDYDIDYYYPTPQDIMMRTLPNKIIMKYVNSQSNYHGDEFHEVDISKLI